MSDARWERIKELVAEALPLAPAERAAFFARACAGDDALRGEVEGLVRASEAAGEGFLRTSAAGAPGAPAGRHLVLGEFELLREIGRGAMGVVYEARQASLGRRVAVKVLSIGLTTTQRQVERFDREAKAVARLNHPGIVPVFTTGRTADAHYFAMEYVQGGNLAEELKRQRHREPGLLSAPGTPDHVQACARAAAELADALQCAHEHGIVHRDVKPQNILLGEGGQLRLVDFGLAKDESQGELTRTGEVAGTPHYMSPEQARARRRTIDHRTDVYSLGVVLYEMLALERPFEGQSAEEVMTLILREEPRPVRRRNPRVPRDLALICATAMAREPRDRYATAAAFAADLRRFLRFESIEARPPGLGRRTQTFARKHALAVTGAVVLVLGAWLGSSWRVHAATRDQRAKVVEELEYLADREWDAVGEDRLHALRVTLAGFEPDGVEQAERRARLERRLEGLRSAWHAEIVRKLGASSGTASPEGVGTVDAYALVDAAMLLMRALAVFPDDAELLRLLSADVFYPRVAIRAEDETGKALAGKVSYRELDQITGVPGELVELGPLPLESRPIPPGFYRFAFEMDGQPFRELTRLLLRAQDPDPIVCTFRSDADPLAGMVRIEGDVLHPHASSEDTLCPFLDHETPVAAFWIDASEVSVRQYRAFLAATGGPPPDEWQWLPADGSYEDRPAVGMSWYEAQGYAEWAGKRLVAHAEWDLAARGPEGALFAPAEGGGAGSFQGTVFGPNVAFIDEQQAFGEYLAHTTAVDAPASARGRNGLFHMLGNVHEWTESLGFDRIDDDTRYVPRPADRLSLSSPWYAAARGFTLATMSLRGPERRFTNAETGFRCARSVSP